MTDNRIKQICNWLALGTDEESEKYKNLIRADVQSWIRVGKKQSGYIGDSWAAASGPKFRFAAYGKDPTPIEMRQFFKIMRPQIESVNIKYVRKA